MFTVTGTHRDTDHLPIRTCYRAESVKKGGTALLVPLQSFSEGAFLNSDLFINRVGNRGEAPHSPQPADPAKPDPRFRSLQ